MFVILRFLSLSLGGLILAISVPCSMLAAGSLQGEPLISPWILAIFTLVLAVFFDAGFLFIGVFATRMRVTKSYRIIGAALLAPPILSTSCGLIFSNHPELRTIFTPLLIFSMLLFGVFVWPAFGNHGTLPIPAMLGNRP